MVFYTDAVSGAFGFYAEFLSYFFSILFFPLKKNKKCGLIIYVYSTEAQGDFYEC